MEKKTQGLVIGKNPGNGFTTVRLHYTADPAKRSDEWKRKAFYGMSQKAINTEFEISWETFAGDPVYEGQFNREVHVLGERREPDPEFPTLIRGWDFAGNHSCAVVQYVRGRIYVIDEFPNMGYNTLRIAQDVVEECNMRYGAGFRYVEVIDPSALHEGKTAQGMSCAMVMSNSPTEPDPIRRGLGLNVQLGIQNPDARKNAVMSYLMSNVKGKPALNLNPECHMLSAGFIGGYHYPEKETQNQKRNRPVKNEYSHIHDALQYACTRVLDVGNPEVYFGDIDIEDTGLGFDL